MLMRQGLSCLFAALLCVSTFASAQTGQTRWVGSWATSQQIPEPHNALPDERFRDVTLRQVVRLTMGGAQLRVRLSNAFGTAPLRVDDIQVALSDGGGQRIVAGSSRVVTFAGHRD